MSEEIVFEGRRVCVIAPEDLERLESTIATQAATIERLERELNEARTTNQRLNRRCQKQERRISRWGSRRYTLQFWQRYCMRRIDAARAEVDSLRTQLAASEAAREEYASVAWWCSNNHASFQHGALDNNPTFSIVLLGESGYCFHSDTPAKVLAQAKEYRERVPYKPLDQPEIDSIRTALSAVEKERDEARKEAKVWEARYDEAIKIAKHRAAITKGQV